MSRVFEVHLLEYSHPRVSPGPTSRFLRPHSYEKVWLLHRLLAGKVKYAPHFSEISPYYPCEIIPPCGFESGINVVDTGYHFPRKFVHTCFYPADRLYYIDENECVVVKRLRAHLRPQV